MEHMMKKVNKRFDPIAGFDLEDITEPEEVKMVNEVLNQFLHS